MPELPDVEVFRRHLSATSLKKEVEHTSIRDRQVLDDVSVQAVARRLKGQSLQTTSRWGKYLFVKVSQDGWLVLHFGMTGYLQHLKDSEELPRHTRMVVDFASGDRLAYVCQRKLGKISLTAEVDHFAHREGLGTDALDVGLPEFRAVLDGKRGKLKTALMDQSTIAGIGNVYSDEILFQMQLHPETKTERIQGSQVKKLAETMQHVLKTAIRCHVQPDRMPSAFLLPHRDDLGPCPRCDGQLKKTKVSGRGTVYCPTCQGG